VDRQDVAVVDLPRLRHSVEAEGLEHVDRTRSYVFMSNHQSVLDMGALVLTLPRSWRFVAKRELRWIPFFGWALGLSDQIVIDRSNRKGSVRSLARAAERIRGGLNGIIFPEGTRSPTGEMREFNSRALARGPLGEIEVKYGAPIPTQGMRPEQRNELEALVREAITRGDAPAFQRIPARADAEAGSSRVATQPSMRSSA